MKIKIVNSCRSPLGMPGMKLLDPGNSVEVTKKTLAVLKKNRIVAAWIERGMLEVDDGESGAVVEGDNESDDGPDDDDQDDEQDDDQGDDQDDDQGDDDQGESEEAQKERVIAELKEYGINKTARTELVKLKKLLRRAKKKAQE